ncbi:MAG TPA: HAD family phosphatase [Bryobacteraceae bacterium]|nr:HAD family phosphatase [Bryobacteraceae bacterium]
MLRGIAFDLDGVLIHSTGCHRSAFEEVLLPFGIRDFDYSQYAGWRTPDVIRAELRRCGVAADEAAVRAAADRKTKLARQMLVERNPVADDCRSVLERLAAKYRLALASSGSHGSVHSFLEVNGFGSLFQSVLSGEDVTHAKPDPEIYEKSFAALGLEPASCIVVEDAVSGIEAARRAGADSIGVVGTCSAETLREAGAAHVVARLSEVPDLVDSL